MQIDISPQFLVSIGLAIILLSAYYLYLNILLNKRTKAQKQEIQRLTNILEKRIQINGQELENFLTWLDENNKTVFLSYLLNNPDFQSLKDKSNISSKKILSLLEKVLEQNKTTLLEQGKIHISMYKNQLIELVKKEIKNENVVE